MAFLYFVAYFYAFVWVGAVTILVQIILKRDGIFRLYALLYLIIHFFTENNGLGWGCQGFGENNPP
jgi:hypothetical protein